jgi:hypothetical protein
MSHRFSLWIEAARYAKDPVRQGVTKIRRGATAVEGREEYLMRRSRGKVVTRAIQVDLRRGVAR